MSASTNDRITDVRNAARPNSARVTSGRSAGGPTLACDNLSGWPTASKVHFVTYKIDSNSDVVAGTQLDCYGIVSGNNIGSFTVVDGTDTGHAVGDVVEMLPTAAWGQDLADALTAEHARTGAHNGTAAATLAPLLKATILGYVYPIGSYYINETDSTNPATLFGFGTWAAIQNKMIVGQGSGTFATAGTTGGAETKNLAHTHTGTTDAMSSLQAGVAMSSGAVNINHTHAFTSASSGSTTQDVMNPYIVAYIWKRTA